MTTMTQHVLKGLRRESFLIKIGSQHDKLKRAHITALWYLNGFKLGKFGAKGVSIAIVRNPEKLRSCPPQRKWPAAWYEQP